MLLKFGVRHIAHLISKFFLKSELFVVIARLRGFSSLVLLDHLMTTIFMIIMIMMVGGSHVPFWRSSGPLEMLLTLVGLTTLLVNRRWTVPLFS